MNVVRIAISGTLSRIRPIIRRYDCAVAAAPHRGRGSGARRAGAGCPRTARSAAPAPSARGPSRRASSGRRRESGSTGKEVSASSASTRRASPSRPRRGPRRSASCPARSARAPRRPAASRLRASATSDVDRAAALQPAHLRDRAERARVVAALPDLQVRVAPVARQDPRRELVVEPRRQRLVREARQRGQARPPRPGRSRARRARRRRPPPGSRSARSRPYFWTMHPATTTRSISPRFLRSTCSRIASTDSSLARSMKPHVLTRTTRASASGTMSWPALLQVAEHDLGVDEVLRTAEGHDADGR